MDPEQLPRNLAKNPASLLSVKPLPVRSKLAESSNHQKPREHDLARLAGGSPVVCANAWIMHWKTRKDLEAGSAVKKTGSDLAISTSSELTLDY